MRERYWKRGKISFKGPFFEVHVCQRVTLHLYVVSKLTEVKSGISDQNRIFLHIPVIDIHFNCGPFLRIYMWLKFNKDWKCTMVLYQIYDLFIRHMNLVTIPKTISHCVSNVRQYLLTVSVYHSNTKSISNSSFT